MNRPSKKEIKAALDKMKEQPSGASAPEPKVGKPGAKKTSLRIRKQGI